jgi:hypothetical protein
VDQALCSPEPLHEFETVYPHPFIIPYILRPDPAGLDQLSRVQQLQALAGELTVVRSKTPAWVILLRAMRDHIPMVEVQKTLKEAAVIGDELEFTIHGLSDETQG